MTAICVRCGKHQHPTTLVEDGGRLLLSPGKTVSGHYVNALCWRCERDQRAERMTHQECR